VRAISLFALDYSCELRHATAAVSHGQQAGVDIVAMENGEGFERWLPEERCGSQREYRY
jgi:hypothetical protein